MPERIDETVPFQPLRIAVHEVHLPQGLVVGSFPLWQLSAMARMRAIEVFPVPGGP